MMDFDLPGLIVPVLTPFTENGQLDKQALAKEIDYLVTTNPSILAVAAVEAQEYQYLSDQGRADLIRTSMTLIRGRVPTVVGISHPAVTQTTELARLAKSLGATFVQILIPNRPSGGQIRKSEMTAYMRHVTEAAGLPGFIYHNPGPGAQVSSDTLLELFDLPHVVGCKESSRNMRHIGEVLSGKGADKHYFVTMEVLLGGIQLGCAGGTVPPPAAIIGKKIISAFRNNDTESAIRYQRLFMGFPSLWMRYGLVAVMKVAFEELGLQLGNAYAPFGVIPEEDRAIIRQYVRDNRLFEEES